MLCAVLCVEFPTGCCTERGLRLELSQALSLGDAREETFDCRGAPYQRQSGSLGRRRVKLLEGVSGRTRTRRRRTPVGRPPDSIDALGPHRSCRRAPCQAKVNTVSTGDAGAGRCGGESRTTSRPTSSSFAHFSAEFVGAYVSCGRGDQDLDEDLAKAQTRRCLPQGASSSCSLIRPRSTNRTPRIWAAFPTHLVLGMRQETLEMFRSRRKLKRRSAHADTRVHDSGSSVTRLVRKPLAESSSKDGRGAL